MIPFICNSGKGMVIMTVAVAWGWGWGGDELQMSRRKCFRVQELFCILIVVMVA